MARFIARAQGSRGEVHRLGGDAQAHAQGWSIGGSVYADRDGDNGPDAITFYLNGGSRRVQNPFKLAHARKGDEHLPDMLTIFHPITGEVLYFGPAWKE